MFFALSFEGLKIQFLFGIKIILGVHLY